VFWFFLRSKSEHISYISCLKGLGSSFFRSFGLENLSTVAAANLSANIVSALQAGCFVGALMGWPVADYLGRRTALLISPAFAIIGVVIQSASSGHLAAIYSGRYVV
jgi:hypothetical protein